MCERGYAGESWYGKARFLTSDKTCFLLFSLSAAVSPCGEASYSGASAVSISVALSASATPRLMLRMSSTRRMFARKRFAPGWSGFAMSWNEKNIAALKQWKGPQCTCPGTASDEFASRSGRACPTSWISLSAALTAVSRDVAIRSSISLLLPALTAFPIAASLLKLSCAAAAYGRCSVNRM